MEWLINWLWQGIALTAIAGVAISCLRGLNAATRHRVWWVTLWLVLLLPVVSSALSIAWSDTSTIAQGTGSEPPPAAIVLDTAPSWAIVALSAVWGGWCATSLVRAITSLVALRRFRRRAGTFPAGREARLPLWVTRVGGRAACLRVSNDVRTAGVLGFRPPIIALSHAALATLSDADLDRIVAHEYAHVQRRDDVSCLLLVAVQAFVGLHPAVWWISRAIDLERELACDDWVLALTDDGPRYARCLTALARIRTQGRTRLSLSPGVSVATRRLRARVTRLLESSHSGGTRVSPTVVGVWAPAMLSVAVSLAAVKLVVIREAEAFAATATSAVSEGMVAIAVPQAATGTSTTGTSTAGTSTVGTSAALISPSVERARERRKPSPARPVQSGDSVQDQSAPGLPPPVTVEPLAALPNLRTASSIAPLGAMAVGVAGSSQRPADANRSPSRARISSSFFAGPIAARGGAARSPGVAKPPVRTAWEYAATAGVAIGTGSKIAAVKTAGFFSRLGKSVAGSF